MSKPLFLPAPESGNSEIQPKCRAMCWNPSFFFLIILPFAPQLTAGLQQLCFSKTGNIAIDQFLFANTDTHTKKHSLIFPLGNKYNSKSWMDFNEISIGEIGKCAKAQAVRFWGSSRSLSRSRDFKNVSFMNEWGHLSL